MHTRIGYLLPEFPGQTHTFFWREIHALENLNVEVDVISTRRPPAKIMSHTWSAEAQNRTTYLFPPSRIIELLRELFNCGGISWLRCFRAIYQAHDVSLKGKLRLLLLMLLGVKLAALAKSRGWQHLHVHSCADAANIAMFAHLISQLPYSITLHGPLTDYGKNQVQKWRFAKFSTVITQKLYEQVTNELAGSLSAKIAIAPMGVNTSIFQRSQPYAIWQENTPCHIFSCGRLNPVKGHEDLIKSVALLKEKGLEVYLTIAGAQDQNNDEYRQKLEQIIRELQLENNVCLLGAVSENILKQHLEKAHVFSLASWEEPLGVAIMEAMSMQVPVVVTNAGGVSELVKPGISGLFVEPRSPSQLSKAIWQIISNPELAERLGQAGRNQVKTFFHSNRGAEALLNGILSSS